MSNPITALNGVVAILPVHRPNEALSVFVQGNANDFVWSIQAKAASALSFVTLPDFSGITGANLKSFIPARDTEYRVIVTNMGTATSIYVRTN